MLIRPATAADVSAVLPMVSRICALHQSWDPAKYGFLPDPAQRYARWLPERAADRRSVFLVVEREAEGGQPARLVGFLIGTLEREIPIYQVKDFGFIHDLWVEEDYRNEGVGRLLAMAAIERFKELGTRQVRLDVWYGNEPARKLFESCGFRPAVVEMLLEIKP